MNTVYDTDIHTVSRAPVMDGNNQFNELRSNKRSHSQSHKAVHAHVPISSLTIWPWKWAFKF